MKCCLWRVVGVLLLVGCCWWGVWVGCCNWGVVSGVLLVGCC